MSYYGIGDDPRNRFRKLPRVKRSRSSVGNIRGGGSIGLPNRNQLMGAQPPAQRIPQRQQTGGGSSVTTGPAQLTTEEQQGSGVTGLLAAKEGYDQVNKAYDGGQKVMGKFDAMKNQFADTNSLTDAGINLKNIFSSTYTPTSGVLAQVGNNALNTGSGLGSNASIATQGIQVAPGMHTLPAGGIKAATTGGGAGKGLTGLSSKGSPTGGSKLLGQAGAGLGAGLSAYDISQNGFNFGNTTGLLGSAALLAGGPFTPWGIGLLGASALDSIFDIF